MAAETISRSETGTPVQLARDIVDIPEAVQKAVDDLLIDPGSWLWEVIASVFERYACDNEHCPSRPAWDIARDDLFDSLSTKLDNAVNDVLTTHITRALVAYAAEHPDAPRPSTEPLVSAGA